ncbi:uncharacterized protein LOC143188453 isoform X2 [Calliopsis andreniformis]
MKRQSKSRATTRSGEEKGNRATDMIFGGCKKHVFAAGAAVGARSDGHGADLHATFASRCFRICIRKGGARRFLPPCSIFLSLPLLLSSCFVSLLLLCLPGHSLSRVSASSNPWCTHLWVTGSACRVVNSPLNFR